MSEEAIIPLAISLNTTESKALDLIVALYQSAAHNNDDGKEFFQALTLMLSIAHKTGHKCEQLKKDASKLGKEILDNAKKS